MPDSKYILDNYVDGVRFLFDDPASVGDGLGR